MSEDYSWHDQEQNCIHHTAAPVPSQSGDNDRLLQNTYLFLFYTHNI